AEPPLHPRQLLLALRGGLPQPDVLPLAPARDGEHRGDLPLPPDVPRGRRRLHLPRRGPRRGARRVRRAGLRTRRDRGGRRDALGNRTVLIGVSERTTAQMAELMAERLFEKELAERVIAVDLEKQRSYMHLDVVFTFMDRDTVTIYPKVIDTTRAFSMRPG